MSVHSTPSTISRAFPLTLAGSGHVSRGARVQPRRPRWRPDGELARPRRLRAGRDLLGDARRAGPPQALNTQAVAARTYAITTNVGGATFDLYPDTRSQMYGGLAAETPSTDAAVAAARGQIVTYGGAPVITYFSASSGGHTENVENVWVGTTPGAVAAGGPRPLRQRRRQPLLSVGPRLDGREAASRLGSLVKGQLIGIQVVKRGVSPRILLADVVGTRGPHPVTGARRNRFSASIRRTLTSRRSRSPRARRPARWRSTRTPCRGRAVPPPKQ